MDSADLGGASGFWIFVAVVVVAVIWSNSRQKAEKHETLRRIVERTGTIDEAKLKALFSEPPSEEWNPDNGYRALRVMGYGLYFSSRFAEPPANVRNERPESWVESRLAVADLRTAADTLVIALACAGDDSAFAEVMPLLPRRCGRSAPGVGARKPCALACAPQHWWRLLQDHRG